MLGAERVLAIDKVPERLRMAEEGGAEVINQDEVESVLDLLREMTANRGPDSCIDAVGMEASGHSLPYIYDDIKQKAHMTFDRAQVFRECVIACRKGGTISVPGVYGGFVDKVPLGSLMNKGLTLRSGQTHMMRYMQPLFDRIERGEIDPSFVISHVLPLEEAPRGYKIFRDKQENCTKVVLDPWAEAHAA
jgi:threonine dehydrogenase-like Zn-dependent dehydrogenase